MAFDLEDLCLSGIGDLPVADVDTTQVLLAVEPIRSTKSETANRLRGRIESALDWAAVDGLREGPNPARWKGLLKNRLPAKAKVRRVTRHAALPYDQPPPFMAALRDQGVDQARQVGAVIPAHHPRADARRRNIADRLGKMIRSGQRPAGQSLYTLHGKPLSADPHGTRSCSQRSGVTGMGQADTALHVPAVPDPVRGGGFYANIRAAGDGWPGRPAVMAGADVAEADGWGNFDTNAISVVLIRDTYYISRS